MDYLAIAVNPAWLHFYRHILRFEPPKMSRVENYSFVNRAPAVGGNLDSKTVRDKYRKVYGRREPGKNLFDFLRNQKLEYALHPERPFGSVSDPVMTPELLNHF